ncbi:hypothetical protein SAY87_011504 [Trapa incisa]|uniref:F-box domain-containing protein n=1 Tax=Trapa incisa TaxID=236973 RepID=A0AAN7JIT8_9MYRT|nr:hypothetical protein SAY87_011504 [Trapa incisa]
MDYFDQIPDPLIIQIFGCISDVKTLSRCRAVCRRFNFLVQQSESLLLRVDKVVSDSDLDSLFFFSFLRTLFKSILSTFLCPKAFTLPATDDAPASPARILRAFYRIQELDIELPAGDLRLEKGTVVRYKATFGATLKSCVILGFGGQRSCGFTEELRERVVWVISVLMAAFARHAYVAREVVGPNVDLVRLTVKDQDGEGEVTMDRRGLAECREAAVSAGSQSQSDEAIRNAMPSVRMRMRHLKYVEIGSGVCLEGATLVVVRPSGSHGGTTTGDEEVEDAALAMGTFGGGVYGKVVQALLKSRSYSLEMNSL